MNFSSRNLVGVTMIVLMAGVLLAFDVNDEVPGAAGARFRNFATFLEGSGRHFLYSETTSRLKLIR